MLFTPLSSGLEKTLGRVQFWQDNPGKISGLDTGFKALNAQTGGIEPNDLVVLAGRPGMGKTALGLHCGLKVAKHSCADNEVVIMVSTEMPTDVLMRRAAAQVALVNEHKLRTGEGTPAEYDQFRRGIRTVAKFPFWIADRPGIVTDNLNDKYDEATIGGSVRRLLERGTKPKLLVVDHISRLGDAGSSPNYRIEAIARNLKNLAMETNVPVLLLSQLNRTVEQRDVKRPQLSDLRDSGGTEQEADLVWLMYRQDYYLTEGQTGYNWKLKGKCLIDVAKSRNGPTGEVILGFDNTTTAFSD